MLLSNWWLAVIVSTQYTSEQTDRDTLHVAAANRPRLLWRNRACNACVCSVIIFCYWLTDTVELVGTGGRVSDIVSKKVDRRSTAAEDFAASIFCDFMSSSNRLDTVKLNILQLFCSDWLPTSSSMLTTCKVVWLYCVDCLWQLQ